MDEVIKLASSFRDPDTIVEILLEDGGHFHVQKAILRKASPYFDKALAANLKECFENKLRLPGCSTDSFELFLFWILNAQVPRLASHIEDVAVEHGDDSQQREDLLADSQSKLVRLWVMAEMWLMPKFQNAIMGQIVHILEGRPATIAGVKTAFELAATDSKIVQVLLKEFVYDGQHDVEFLESKELEELGKMPGFLAAFIDGMVQCREKKFLGVLQMKGHWFMVPE